MSGGYVAGGSWSAPGEKVPPNSPAGWVVVSFTDERVWSSEKLRNVHQVTRLPTDQQVFAPFIRLSVALLTASFQQGPRRLGSLGHMLSRLHLRSCSLLT